MLIIKKKIKINLLVRVVDYALFFKMIFFVLHEKNLYFLFKKEWFKPLISNIY